ncbi:hypothetical protein EXIGLDRAFT_723248 [Exidia glandulosa HHB12029]|uniref:Uncharacterized protein n=1 Tax=Exidia glandulosa HHB12029 TaxID=1314781 RepID=A0A165EXA9_EXIGL|nr:hypothetical protein EXIGLDRAFT_723248 [Exidia glandulosa HHB12029]
MAIAIALSVVAFAIISLLLVIFLRRRAGRLRTTSPLTDSSTHASTGTRFDTTIRPFTLTRSPPQRSKTSTDDHFDWQPSSQVPRQDAAHDEPGPPRPSIDSARTRVALY